MLRSLLRVQRGAFASAALGCGGRRGSGLRWAQWVGRGERAGPGWRECRIRPVIALLVYRSIDSGWELE